MKKNLIIIFYFFGAFTSYSQYSERFNEITESITRSEFKIDTTFFSNGNIKKIKGISTYDYEGDKIFIETGEIIRFYRNGKIKTHFVTDNFGIYLSGLYYNRSGDITREFLTTEIDTSIEDPELFFSTQSHIDFKRHHKYYRYSKKIDAYYLYAEDFQTVVNDEKKILRKFINPDGEVTKIENL